ncbi:MAG: hypothetical protein MHPSP_001986, partial [Paramarteilia canceri]
QYQVDHNNPVLEAISDKRSPDSNICSGSNPLNNSTEAHADLIDFSDGSCRSNSLGNEQESSNYCDTIWDIDTVVPASNAPEENMDFKSILSPNPGPTK